LALCQEAGALFGLVVLDEFKILNEDLISFLHFCNYLSFEQDLVLYLKNFEFCLQYFNYIRMICINFHWNWPACSGEEEFQCCYNRPLEKGIALHLNNFESLSPKDDLCQLWLQLAQRFWRRSKKCKKKSNRQTDGQTDARQRAIRKPHLSFQLRWAKKLKQFYAWTELGILFNLCRNTCSNISVVLTWSTPGLSPYDYAICVSIL
jgi:hypothetical protein